MPKKSLMDWIFGPEVLSKREVLDLIDKKERHHVQRFESQVQILKAKISEFERLRHRVNQLEAGMPKRDAKGHFLPRCSEAVVKDNAVTFA